MVRQYIGARYVPKFFENPNNTAEWLPNVIYEPLTIVTYGPNTYTSKKTVPASVGDPSNNPEYWVVTSNYNAFLDELQEEIDEINNETIPGINQNIANTNTRIDHVKDRKFIFLADSYGDADAFTYPVWTELVPQYLGLSSGDYYAKGFSGVGFVGGSGTFLGGLQNIGANIDDKTTITDIYVLGGINDQSSSADTIASAIDTFMAYCKTNYPKAHVHIGVISLNTDSTAQYNMRTRVVPGYMRSPSYGASFVNGMDFIARYDYLNADGSHPTQTGQVVLSRYIADYVLNGYSGTKHEGTTFSLSAVNGTLGGDSSTIVTYEKNGIYTMKLQGRLVYITFDNADSIGPAPTTLFNIPSNVGCFPHGGSEYDIPVTFTIKQNGTWSNTVYHGVLFYDGTNGIIRLYHPISSLTNVEGVALTTFEFTAVTYLD